MKYLLEFKNIGPLYHIIDMEKLKFIIENDFLKPKHFFGGISTTRNKMMNGYTGDSPVSIFKLELNSQKLSNNYKITPISDTTTEIDSYGYRKTVHFNEFEERIITNKIYHISKYINKLIIIKKRIENLKNTGWFTSDGGFFDGKRLTIPDFFKEYIQNCKLPIYIQDNTIIKKDDKWVNSIINYPIKKINHGYIYYKKEYKKHPKIEHGLKDYYIPLDNNNNEITDVVVGYKYKNLYLYTNKQKINSNDYYMFDFEYETSDIIKKNNNYIKIKIAKLRNVKRYFNKNN